MKLVYVGVLLAGMFGAAACQSAHSDCASDETSCSDGCTNLDSDKDNCGACGSACGDGMVCSASQCVPGCDGDESRCDGVCTDTNTDTANCGACGSACTSDEVCASGTCGCATGDITCGGICTDPKKDDDFCGASGDCTGSNAGTRCGTNEGCLNGTCASSLIYRGSLPSTVGNWNYGGTQGIDGANAVCAAHWPGSAICSYTQMMTAQSMGELTNLTDYNGNPVAAGTNQFAEFWMDDGTADPTTQCDFSVAQGGPGIRWSYQTAHLGNVGRYVQWNSATGTIGPVKTGVITAGTGECLQLRFVACCTIDPAP
jgi:hypothetical protein